MPSFHYIYVLLTFSYPNGVLPGHVRWYGNQIRKSGVLDDNFGIPNLKKFLKFIKVVRLLLLMILLVDLIPDCVTGDRCLHRIPFNNVWGQICFINVFILTHTKDRPIHKSRQKRYASALIRHNSSRQVDQTPFLTTHMETVERALFIQGLSILYTHSSFVRYRFAWFIFVLTSCGWRDMARRCWQHMHYKMA